MLLRDNKNWMQRPIVKAMDDKKFDALEMCEIAKKDTRVFTIKEMLRFYLKEISKRARAAEFGQDGGE